MGKAVINVDNAFGLLFELNDFSVNWYLLQARVSDTNDGVEEGYESSRDEISSVSSYNPLKENLFKSFRSSLSFESTTARSSNRDGLYHDIDCSSLSSNVGLHRLSVAEIMHDSSTGN